MFQFSQETLRHATLCINGWVPDHAGVECNECADELTKRGGANMPFLGAEP